MIYYNLHTILILLTLSLSVVGNSIPSVGISEPENQVINSKYRLLKEIGKGAFGAVFSAQDVTFPSNYYAIKVMEIEDKDTDNSIKEEIKALKSFDDHPYICKLLDVIRLDNMILLVMPLYNGDLVDFYNEHGGLNNQMIKLIFHQLYLAMKHIHSKGWAHRDLKLSNIMYVKKPKFEIKVSDFGMATNDLYSRTDCGTDGFMSLECKNGVKYNTQSNDVWSLGSILLQLKTGEAFNDAKYLKEPPTSTVKKSVMKRMLGIKSSQNLVKMYASGMKISKNLAKILLKVFVPEDKRIGLDELHELVMDL